MVYNKYNSKQIAELKAKLLATEKRLNIQNDIFGAPPSPKKQVQNKLPQGLTQKHIAMWEKRKAIMQRQLSKNTELQLAYLYRLKDHDDAEEEESVMKYLRKPSTAPTSYQLTEQARNKYLTSSLRPLETEFGFTDVFDSSKFATGSPSLSSIPLNMDRFKGGESKTDLSKTQEDTSTATTPKNVSPGRKMRAK